jgi:hypothetical protein
VPATIAGATWRDLVVAGGELWEQRARIGGETLASSSFVGL